MMTFDLDEAVAVLERTPGTLRALLEGLPDGWIRCDEGGETWTAFDVVGHLIHGERTDWIPRARMILEHGESRPFEPFDRFAMFEASRSRSLADLLDEFDTARTASLAELRRLVPAGTDLGRMGTHPALGRVTLAELLATWVAHDLDHIVQIARVMAKRYADDVGPWRAYLGVLHDRVGRA